MKTTINEHDFVRAFELMGRRDQFSFVGLKSLFSFLDELDTDCETETELDVIALCCDFTEYTDLEAFQAEYGSEDYPDIDTIREHTTVIDVEDGGFIIQCF